MTKKLIFAGLFLIMAISVQAQRVGNIPVQKVHFWNNTTLTSTTVDKAWIDTVYRAGGTDVA
ncbi:MAG: hypothetical protein AABY46_07310, partial [Nitrospirota bacterium]